MTIRQRRNQNTSERCTPSTHWDAKQLSTSTQKCIRMINKRITAKRALTISLHSQGWTYGFAACMGRLLVLTFPWYSAWNKRNENKLRRRTRKKFWAKEHNKRAVVFLFIFIVCNFRHHRSVFLIFGNARAPILNLVRRFINVKPYHSKFAYKIQYWYR